MSLATRGMIHAYGRKSLGIAFGAAFATTAAFFFLYVQPRHYKYEEYFKNYNAYERMREICSHGPGLMHTCPQDLAKLYEEKGKPIASL